VKVTESFRCYDCLAMIRLAVVPAATPGSKQHARTCADCSRTFPNFEEWYHHMRRRCAARKPCPLACRRCGKLCKSVQGLRGHDNM
jgi:hypothetical protein